MLMEGAAEGYERGYGVGHPNAEYMREIVEGFRETRGFGEGNLKRRGEDKVIEELKGPYFED